ncbi:MAG: LysR family transcriptional regulator [Lachnospiraceae bacterium]|nr:LysR family transcriptional regulator [Lachnospiraceae bacterium]
MTLSQIECFIEIARTGSFSKAAGNLFMTQQGASNQIRSLEKELGFPVFVRKNKGVELTEEGRILFEHWGNAFNEIKIGIDKAKDEFSGHSTDIRIGLQDMGKCSNEIMASFAEFEDRHKDLHLIYEIMSPKMVYQEFDNNNLDIAICYSSELNGLTSKYQKIDLHNRPLNINLFYSVRHPLAEKKNASLADFADKTVGILSDKVSFDFKKQELRFFSINNLKFTGDFLEFDNRRNLELALISGRCFSIVYETMFENADRNIKAIKMGIDDPDAKISLFWKDKDMNIKAQILSSILKEHLSILD